MKNTYFVPVHEEIREYPLPLHLKALVEYNRHSARAVTLYNIQGERVVDTGNFIIWTPDKEYDNFNTCLVSEWLKAEEHLRGSVYESEDAVKRAVKNAVNTIKLPSKWGSEWKENFQKTIEKEVNWQQVMSSVKGQVISFPYKHFTLCFSGPRAAVGYCDTETLLWRFLGCLRPAEQPDLIRGNVYVHATSKRVKGGRYLPKFTVLRYQGPWIKSDGEASEHYLLCRRGRETVRVKRGTLHIPEYVDTSSLTNAHNLKLAYTHNGELWVTRNRQQILP